jgi:hypothetical protein
MEKSTVFPTGTTYEIDASTTLNNGDVVRTVTTFEFGGCTLDDVLQWASCDRRIALQRAVRGLNTNDARDHMNSTVMAKTAGHKPIDIDELIASLPPEALERIRTAGDEM